jgi:hypothetical protein
MSYRSLHRSAALRVCIIGSGAAGLHASALLRRAGVDVLHLEADKQIGGRLRPLVDRTLVDFPIELGAEEIHGEKCTLASWARSCDGVEVVDHYKELDDFFWLDDKLVDEKIAEKDPDVRAIDKFSDWIEEKYKGPDNLTGTYSDYSPRPVTIVDQTFVQYLCVSLTVEEAAKQRKIPARVHHLLEMEFGLENGTCNTRMSVAGHGENERAWKCGNKNFLLRGGSLLQVVASKV